MLSTMLVSLIFLLPPPPPLPPPVTASLTSSNLSFAVFFRFSNPELAAAFSGDSP